MLAPEMFTSPSVCNLPVPARWTFAGTLTYLDDYGYGEDSPALVKAAVWPRDDAYTTAKVASHLDLIVAEASLCRFECCGRKVIHSSQWRQWQTVAHPGKPRFCVCPVHSHLAQEDHVTASRAFHETFNRNVVEVKLDQSSSSAESRRAMISDALGRAI